MPPFDGVLRPNTLSGGSRNLGVHKARETCDESLGARSGAEALVVWVRDRAQ